MTAKSTIFIVDSDREHGDHLEQIAVSMGYGTEQFGSAGDFLDWHSTHDIGCVVAEVRIWDISGLQLQQRLLDLESCLPVIFVSDCSEVSVVTRALKGGAFDYFEKPADELDLRDSIQRANQLSRKRHTLARQRAAWRARLDRLSAGERDVLDELLKGVGNRDVAKSLGIAIRTVETRKRRLMGKLEKDSVYQIQREHYATARCCFTCRGQCLEGPDSSDTLHDDAPCRASSNNDSLELVGYA